MKYVVKIYKNYKYITCEGEIQTYSENFDNFNQYLRDLSQKEKVIILDFDKVETIDSLGIGAILTSYVILKRKEGFLIIYRPSKHMDMILQLSKVKEKLHSVFTVEELNNLLDQYNNK